MHYEKKLPVPKTDLRPNTAEFENFPFVKPTGFREYDARWLYPQEINLLGFQSLGASLGTQLFESGKPPKIIVAHDYRSYSLAVKNALITGLITAGVQVIDIGLCLSPVAYFAQFHLDCEAVAMVTASHNENGWTGVKIGFNRPCTHGPDEMTRLKEITLGGLQIPRPGGELVFYNGIRQDYIEDFFKNRKPFKRKMKAVIACGNGTPGLFAPEILEKAGLEIVHLHTSLDYNFPHYNPNPEDMEMLHDLSKTVKENGADIGLAFDGDGDRCGVVDNLGRELFADKGGVLLARHFAKLYPGSKFIADVKSTGLFLTDPILMQTETKTEYWKTGHSYMKRRVTETGALAGFEKSGHYFINAPIGRGYDDGILSALLMCDLLEANPDQSFADLSDSLPVTHLSPTMSPYCDDLKKYEIVDQAIKIFENKAKDKKKVAGREIVAVSTVNGIRFTLEDGAWGLIRASSNKPNLVVVTESSQSAADMKAIFDEIDAVLRSFPEVGEYDQRL